MDPRTPNLFIIGAPKAGTTFVHHALQLADGVSMSSVKEPGFFTSRDHRRGLRYYLDAYFAHAAGHALRGESTPWYLYSDIAAKRIADMPSDEPVRFLVMVRRPSDRAYSMYRDLVRVKREDRTFEQAVEAELEGMAAGTLEPKVHRRYVWCGQYAPHIDRWREAFGPDRVHVSVFDDLSACPDQLWKELANFLAVDLGPDRFDAVDPRDRNPGGPQRFPRFDRLIRSLEGRDSPAVERMKRVLPPGLHRRVLEQLVRFNRASEPTGRDALDPELGRRIDQACAEQTRRLEALIGRSLPDWMGDVPEPSSLPGA